MRSIIFKFKPVLLESINPTLLKNMQNVPTEKLKTFTKSF